MYAQCNCNIEIDSFSELNDELGRVLDKNVNVTDLSVTFIDDRTYQNNLVLLEADVLYNVARMRWIQVEEMAFSDTYPYKIDVYETRKQIVDMLSLSRYSVQSCSNVTCKQELQNRLMQYLKLLLSSINRWTALEERLLVKLASPTNWKDDHLPAYHYFHMYLDAQWLITSMLCVAGEQTKSAFRDFLQDLIIFQYTYYMKQETKNIAKETSFVCRCIKRTWILMQLLYEHLFSVGKIDGNFWEVFNTVVKDYQDEVFILWLLRDIATLHGYDIQGEFLGTESTRMSDNHILISENLRAISAKCTSTQLCDNQMLLNCCRLIDPLLNQWWKQNIKLEPYQLLWEIFNKHLNVDFCECSKANSINKILELVQNILKPNCVDNTANSYECFLSLLNRYLMQFPNQWHRMRGRIYSKLPQHKVNEFTEAGLLNIALLFLSLAAKTNLTEVSNKLIELLSGLKPERLNSCLIFNVHMSILVLYVQQGCSIREVSMPVLALVQTACDSREKFHLMRLYIKGLDAILSASSSFEFHQYLLIDDWVCKFLPCCQYSDLCYFLNVLSYNLKRIQSAGGWDMWESTLKEHVLPALKQVAMDANAPVQVGELAAIIDPNPASDWVFTFTSDLVSPKVMCHFISTLLEDVGSNFVLPKNQEAAILHAWIRCCLLNCEDSEKLTKNVMKLQALSSVLDIQQKLGDKPLVPFITAITNPKANAPYLRELCDQCFGQLNWIDSYLADPKSEALTLHIYTCMAVLFSHCAPLLYHKNRSSCLLNRLINTFLLPTGILMGNPPHRFVLSAIQWTWHHFVKGIFALDRHNDAYLERMLRDMVVRYVPLLSDIDSPILKCMDDKELASLILEKISTSFLSRSSRSSDGNTTKALKVIHLAIENASLETLQLILQCTLASIMEVIIFHVHKSAAVEVIRFIAAHEQYGQVRNYMECAILTVTEKHLAFSTNNYFQFVNIMVKVIPRELRAIVHSIRKQVVELERMRSVDRDHTLRQGLERLEELLLN